MRNRVTPFARRALAYLPLFPALLGVVGCIEFESEPIKKPKIDLGGIVLPDGGRIPPGFLEDGGLPQGVGGADLPPEVLASLPRGFPIEFLQGAKIGEQCSQKEPCRESLSCKKGSCTPSGKSAEGDFCLVSAECAAGQCVSSVCAPAGDGTLGDLCESSAECEAGLRCGVVGLSARCLAEGEGDIGSPCATTNDCLSGLACFQRDSKASPKCQPLPGAPPAVPVVWEGVKCSKPSTDSVRAYFEIPSAPGAQEDDFFRLPFPNDILTDARGRVDVDKFPSPGVNPIVGVDPIKPYVDAVDGTKGWGTNSTVTFRFSGEIDFNSFDGNDAINWVDITDPAKPVNAPINFRAYSGNTNYVCHNVFSIRRGNGYPMKPGHTYAVWLGSAGRSAKGAKIDRAENFSSMLAEGAPANPVLAAAHQKFAPFRSYLAASQINPDDVLVGTVITVGPVRDLMAQLAAGVRGTPLPASSAWTLCGGAAKSPCAQAEEGRACGTNPAFDEYHALLDLPIFQGGAAPYLKAGGKIDPTQPTRTEPVCISLAVPKGAEMPESGWPLVVFGHGTGGSFRSHIPIAAELTAAATPNGMVNFAVLGFDEVQHGPRRGESNESPDNLFFNFLNPDAAQGNPLQGAADLISIARFAAALDLSAAQSKGEAIKIDPERMVYLGHSQGSMHGSLALPFADEYKGAVLSGNGASLMHALLTKTNPVNIAQVVPLVVNDGVKVDPLTQSAKGELPGGDHHPVLSLIQHHIDPADPLTFAKQISREPLEGFLPKHVFQTYGLGDTFSPPTTLRIYAKAGDFTVVRAHSSAMPPDDLGAESSDFPVTSTFAVNDVQYTSAVRQYGPPTGRDGHFVVFDVPEATADAVRFLGMSASGMTPQIGQ
ncbi:MAG: hypothetical protein RJA70_3662 [Pseudomonadota bacterium]|jgi:pimeloyl-ACP methyl ester carboxylesterase